MVVPLDLTDRDLIGLRAAMLEIVAAEGEGESATLRESVVSGRFGPLHEAENALGVIGTVSHAHAWDAGGGPAGAVQDVGLPSRRP